MQSKLFLDIYTVSKIKLMCSEKNNVARRENQEGSEQSFVGYIQILSDMTATTFKSSGLPEYPVCAVPMNFSNWVRRYLI